MNDKQRSHIVFIVAEALNIESSDLSLLMRSQIPSWDSLKHIELILTLEEELQIRFSSKEVARIECLDDLVQIIEVKL